MRDGGGTAVDPSPVDSSEVVVGVGDAVNDYRVVTWGEVIRQPLPFAKMVVLELVALQSFVLLDLIALEDSEWT